MSKRTVYMDNNATTPIHPSVKAAYIEMLDCYGNASSMHRLGREAGGLVENARQETARLIGAQPEEIIFTDGGSESNNTVLKTFLELCGTDFGIVTSAVEHPSVLNTVRYLGSRGVPVTIVGVDQYGLVDMDHVEEALNGKVKLVSVMAANNEIGTLQDIKSIARIAHDKGVLVHTDAVQLVGKLPLDVNDLGLDYCSFSGHKLYGPKGVGGLFVRKGAPLLQLIHGGHQEEGRRAGTLNSPSIIAMGKAVSIAEEEMEDEAERQLELKNRLRRGIEEVVPDIRINGHPEKSLPGTLNVSFLGAEGESILLYLDMEGIEVSTGSACATGSLEPSYVITSICEEMEYAHGSIRFSLGRENTREDVDYVIEKLPPIIERLRKMSTLCTDRTVHQVRLVSESGNQ